MWNVIRAQLYQLKRDFVVWGVTILALFMMFVINLDAFDMDMTGSEATAYMGESMCILVGLLIMMIIVANVMGKDFLDKTLNYEVLSGHTRKDVFFGRFMVAMTASILCAFLIIISVPAVLTIMNGWGNTMEFHGVLIRFGLILITLFRISCELAFLTTLAKNPYITYLVAIVLSEVQIILSTAQSQYSDFETSPLLPVSNCLNLFTFQDWTTFFLDETDQIFYSSAVTSEMVLWTLIPSIVIGVVMLLLTYVFFRHDDLN